MRALHVKELEVFNSRHKFQLKPEAMQLRLWKKEKEKPGTAIDTSLCHIMGASI